MYRLLLSLLDWPGEGFKKNMIVLDQKCIHKHLGKKITKREGFLIERIKIFNIFSSISGLEEF